MTHPFMTAVAEGLADRNIATLRYQFPYMEQGSKRLDVRRGASHGSGGRAIRLGPVTGCPACRWRQVLRRAHDISGAGRGASARRQRPRLSRLPFASRGQAGRWARGPSDGGTGPDALSPRDARYPRVHESLGPVDRQAWEQATLSDVEDADHSFHVPARSGKTDQQVMHEMLDVMAGWISRLNS